MASRINCWFACHLTLRQLNYFAPHLPSAMPPTLTTNIYINPDLSSTDAKLTFEARQRRRERIAQQQATDADHAVDTANTTQDISVADQDPGTIAMTTTATATTTPTAITSTGIATTTPSSLSDTTVPVQTTKLHFRSQ